MIKTSNVVVDNKKSSCIAFGTHQCSKKEQYISNLLLDTYFEWGGNVIDTARCYGESEECVGDWINSNGIREKLILITKGCNHDLSGGVSKSRLNALELEKDIEESLKYLKTDYIDIYFLHKDDVLTSPSEAIDMLNKYVKMGVIKHIGASNWIGKRIEEANDYAKKYGIKPFEFSELAFSLKQNSTFGWGELDKALELNKEEYAWYKESKIPIFGYNPQAYGFFYKKVADASETAINKYILRQFYRVCEENEINANQALFGFYFGCDIKNVPIISTKNLEHLKETLNNCNVVLDKKTVKELLNLSLR